MEMEIGPMTKFSGNEATRQKARLEVFLSYEFCKSAFY